jgi:two-component system, LuxR family, sensor kinase FixL
VNKELDDDQARAAQRHLQDRERLLFLSRSVSIGEMASTLAHEINQPIGTISNVLRGMASRLARITLPPGDNAKALAEIAQGLKLAQDQAQFAARIVGRIREYTHSRQPRREVLDLQALLQECVALLDWEFARHGVQVHTTAAQPAWVQGDAVMLQQVVVNLLRNALDAQRAVPSTTAVTATTAPRVSVSMQVQPTVDGAGEVEIAIADQGCGISREAEDLLFVPFQSSKPDGMGIGLKICRSFIELHQGRLWFTRNTGPEGKEGGCTFHIALKQLPAPKSARQDEHTDDEKVSETTAP